jgi:hypothetical protein
MTDVLVGLSIQAGKKKDVQSDSPTSLGVQLMYMWDSPFRLGNRRRASVIFQPKINQQ